MARSFMVLIAAAMVFMSIAVMGQQSYDEYEDSPTVYLEGCGVFPAIRLVIDGRETEARAFVRNGRTYLPAREALERLGANVRWVSGENAFYAQFPERNRTIRVTVGSPVVNVYRFNAAAPQGAGQQVQTFRMNASPIQCEGRIFAPVRAATEAAGGRVHYDRGARTVYIYSPNQSR